MFELKYENAAKGLNHLNDMLASSTTTAYDQAYTIVNDSQKNSNIFNPGENITNMNYNATDTSGPMRVGIFASSTFNPSRIETGCSYFEIMALSGNLYESWFSYKQSLHRSTW